MASSTSRISTVELPPRVAAWLAHVLPPQVMLPQRLDIRQSGRLRTGIDSSRWQHFKASQQVWPQRHAFCWQARVRLLPGVWIRVQDGYEKGLGRGEIKLWSCIPLARERGGEALNSAALIRFLAESVWYPALLLSDTSIHWHTLGTHAVCAEIKDAGQQVSVEFYFNQHNEVCRVYSPGRQAREAGGYRLRPWEARLGDYRRIDGVLIPTSAEVGWYRDERFHPVWQGEISAFCASSA